MVTVVALAAVVVVYGFGLVKFLGERMSGRGPPRDWCHRSPVLAAALIFVVLGIEVGDVREQGEVPIVSAALDRRRCGTRQVWPLPR